tara:strand:- start:1367 stop:2344 length:978 start_codon:yes stop_codon:yes gene_type:complete
MPFLSKKNFSSLKDIKTISCFIFVARSDFSYLATTLPPLLEMATKANCTTTILVDGTNPDGVLGQSLPQTALSKLISCLEKIQQEHSFEIEVIVPKPDEIREFSRLHLGKPHMETHCFRGYPIHSSISQFLKAETDYVLHFDCDMLFHEQENFSWIQSGIELMETNQDILCVLPRGGPPNDDNSINQGTTEYELDEKRALYLFKNFTSRHYLAHRNRFLDLLPFKPLWLSWREPIKSKLFGKGKMLCWENMVEEALTRSKYWRADFMSKKAWSLHPGDRCEGFHNMIGEISKHVQKGNYPEAQRGHFDLRLNDWQSFIKANQESA